MDIKLPSLRSNQTCQTHERWLLVYPNPAIHKGLENISDYRDELLGADHPWITEQVELVKNCAGFEEDIVVIYNIFAPVTYFKWLVGEARGEMTFGRKLHRSRCSNP